MPDKQEIEQAVTMRINRIDAALFSATLGAMAGAVLFVLTNWLVLRGGPPGPEGPVVGPHLSLLGQFFPGYDVSFVGSLLGFFYAFACGGIAAYSGARIYNKIADLRHGRPDGT